MLAKRGARRLRRWPGRLGRRLRLEAAGDRAGRLLDRGGAVPGELRLLSLGRFRRRFRRQTEQRLRLVEQTSRLLRRAVVRRVDQARCAIELLAGWPAARSGLRTPPRGDQRRSCSERSCMESWSSSTTRRERSWSRRRDRRRGRGPARRRRGRGLSAVVEDSTCVVEVLDVVVGLRLGLEDRRSPTKRNSRAPASPRCLPGPSAHRRCPAPCSAGGWRTTVRSADPFAGNVGLGRVRAGDEPLVVRRGEVERAGVAEVRHREPVDRLHARMQILAKRRRRSRRSAAGSDSAGSAGTRCRRHPAR